MKRALLLLAATAILAGCSARDLQNFLDGTGGDYCQRNPEICAANERDRAAARPSYPRKRAPTIDTYTPTPSYSGSSNDYCGGLGMTRNPRAGEVDVRYIDGRRTTYTQPPCISKGGRSSSEPGGTVVK